MKESDSKKEQVTENPSSKPYQRWKAIQSKVIPVTLCIAVAAAVVAGPIGLVATAAIGWGTKKLCNSKVNTLAKSFKATPKINDSNLTRLEKTKIFGRKDNHYSNNVKLLFAWVY